MGHGAGVAALNNTNNARPDPVEGSSLSSSILAFPPLDYEQPIPDAITATYIPTRSPFAITGSPSLPNGLNIGNQLAWMDALYPAEMASATLLPWAQYWAWWLSGMAHSEVSSLGCHSDLWSPDAAEYSPMAKSKGWAGKFAPLAKASDCIGHIRPNLASATGLPTSTKILTGLHDSNAALLAARGFAALDGQEFTTLSTGTWFINMRSIAAQNDSNPITTSTLPETRDCLVNIDVHGHPVPSSRLMGGREVELLTGPHGIRIDRAGTSGISQALSSGTLILPSQIPDCGPFPKATPCWINKPHDPDTRAAAIALYAALMADVSLNLIGASGKLLIEGRFAASEIFTRALASLRPETQLYTAASDADVSFGALRLIDPTLRPSSSLTQIAPLDADIATLRQSWQQAILESQTEHAA